MAREHKHAIAYSPVLHTLCGNVYYYYFIQVDGLCGGFGMEPFPVLMLSYSCSVSRIGRTGQPPNFDVFTHYTHYKAI